jgi:hypothetical protein
MIINTKLDVAHLELIKIFIKANDLLGVEVNEVPLEIRGKFHMVLQLDCKYDESAQQLSLMGLRHSGILNMFDDYLLKCDVLPNALQPDSIVRQEAEERQAKVLENFEEKQKKDRLKNTKAKIEHTNE